MLLNEQAAELLKRCEKILGTELSQIRGNLSKAEGRAPAVWEMLVLEATSKLGKIEYEPHPGRSPDIKLHLPESRPVWIEVAFLYPRFWKEERKSREVTNWIFMEAERLRIPACKIYPRLDGIQQNGAGPVRKLPELNERKKFLSAKKIREFFDGIIKEPNVKRHFDSDKYTISITYSPNATGRLKMSGGLSQEAPTSVEEHALYRVLKEKAKQHTVNGPRIICIGSDQSPALSRLHAPMQVRLEDAISKIFLKNKSLSAVITVLIENSYAVFGGTEKVARGNIFINQHCKTPLTTNEIQLIEKLNFNSWKYSFPLANWKPDGREYFPKVSGRLTWRPDSLGWEVEIPANVVVAALAGKTTLAKEFNLKNDERISQVFSEGWDVEGCFYKDGNIELGEAPKIILRLSPPFRIYDKDKEDA